MNDLFRFVCLAALVGGFVVCKFENQANGQQIGISTPFTTLHDSFYENFGVNFGFHFGGGRGYGGGNRIVGLLGNGQFSPDGSIGFTQNSAGSAVPVFGGYDPGANGNIGFGNFGSGGGFSLGLSFGKGSTRTYTSQVPSITVQNGGGGSFFSGGFQPFVTGVFPVIGNGPVCNGVTLAMESGQLDLSRLGQESRSSVSSSNVEYVTAGSTATRAMAGVDEIKARKERERAANSAAIAEHLSQAEKAIEAKDFSTARSYFRRAIGLETDPSNLQILKSQLESLRGR